ncbi:MAG: hypothetical protein AAGE94_08310 [Acidobacteriota bacterium]
MTVLRGYRTYLSSAALTALGILQAVGVLDLDPEKLQSAAVALIGAAIAFARAAIGRHPTDDGPRPAVRRSSLYDGLGAGSGTIGRASLVVLLGCLLIVTSGCATWDTVLGSVAEAMRDTRMAAPAVEGSDAILISDPTPAIGAATGLAFEAMVEGERRGQLGQQVAILCPAQLQHVCRGWAKGQPIRVQEAHWRVGELVVDNTTHHQYLELAACRTRAGL